MGGLIPFAESLLGPGLPEPSPVSSTSRSFGRLTVAALAADFAGRYPALRDFGALPAWVELVERLRASARLQSCFLTGTLEYQFAQLPCSLLPGWQPVVAHTSRPYWVLLAAYLLYQTVTRDLFARIVVEAPDSAQLDTIRFLLGQVTSVQPPPTLADLTLIAQINRGLFAWAAQLITLQAVVKKEARTSALPNLSDQINALQTSLPYFAVLSPLFWPGWFAQQPENVPGLYADGLQILIKDRSTVAAAAWLASRLADTVTPQTRAAARSLGAVFGALTPQMLPNGREDFPHPQIAAFLTHFYYLLLRTWRPHLDACCQALNGLQADFAALFRPLSDLLELHELVLVRSHTDEMKTLSRQIRSLRDEGLDRDFDRIRASFLQARETAHTTTE